MGGAALPCSRPARCALRAICDGLPRHRPAAWLSAPWIPARCFQSAREEGDFLIFIGIPDESASRFGAGHDPEATELHGVD